MSVDSEDGSACEPSCLVLESDFLLSGELEFEDSEIMGLDRDSGSCCLSDIEKIRDEKGNTQGPMG